MPATPSCQMENKISSAVLISCSLIVLRLGEYCAGNVVFSNCGYFNIIIFFFSLAFVCFHSNTCPSSLFFFFFKHNTSWESQIAFSSARRYIKGELMTLICTVTMYGFLTPGLLWTDGSVSADREILFACYKKTHT